ncbi:MAG: MarR family winged helix-turn-helix transcriptional regulator [Desulfuromonadaceae bacterium]|nr:MarR family winged helix-turn-helix transcriptional regulator [Desulfuromonadaceae bacterium]
MTGVINLKSSSNDSDSSLDTGDGDSSAPLNLTSLNEAPQIPEGNNELRIFQSLRRIIRAIELHSHKLNTGYQITGPQLGCLLAIKDNGPLTITRLSNIVFLSPSTVVGIVDRLDEKGLVSRIRSIKDRRQVQICLTEAGNHLAVTAPSPLQEKLSGGLKSLPPSELVSITAALDKLVNLMEAEDISAAPILETGLLAVSTENQILHP